ncbi:She10p CYBJADRAFT_189267 [Cyberlindnera jadinii NRRL Y-1542]|uniref:Outer spore wall assembly protein SHE10 n=1 Tax=Cyberlindnera jadinii (strain ATCC 18201 / CBS 1600 / BCRC 20928 / JCM 3617 / NBRC 0987 / NRRL Y-1542) TaxID=983966 RepID=A0A1E4S3X0_CYBJN|nr:hypothetical protein CYBJADRAFT_189267 [Cyberlindnera jadinii NRRL Y-1542]ODV74143.1 hypothetical protein CYBJADRAFT_189267 [Cyberlindnera jadinii NRRL Y-1542]
MVCPNIKRLVVWSTLVFVLARFVDFSSSEFDPVRSQWTGSVEYLTSNKIYGEYIQPINEKVNPYVTELSDNYVRPSISKVTAITSDKYKVYLSNYVALACAKFTSSPVYDFWIEQKPRLDSFYAKSLVSFDKLRALTTRYIAIFVIESQRVLKLAAGKSCQCSCAAKKYIHDAYVTLKPQACAFYKSKVVPVSKEAWSQTLKYTRVAYEQSKQFYISTAQPLLEKYVYAHVRPLYVKYLAGYVDKLTQLLVKYYTLFRLNDALNASKKLISGSYDQALVYFNKDSYIPTEIEPTTSFEEDLPTDTDIDFEAAETVRVTDDSEDEIEPEAATTDDEVPLPQETPVVEGVTEEKDLKELDRTKSTDEEDNAVVLSLAEEISEWKRFIVESVQNIFKNFDTTISTMESEQIEEFQPKLSKALQDMTTKAQLNFQEINKAIYNIDSKTVLLDNGDEAEVDRNGNIIDHKITRQEIRDILAEKKDFLKERADAINILLRSFVSGLEAQAEEERTMIVDVYEEFAEVAINEFSKKMMYSSFASSFDNLQKGGDGENVRDWKDYLKIKKDLISNRDVLIDKAVEFPLVEKLLSEIYQTMKTLEQENGSYFAILRAQANLAFQEREQHEREVSQHLEEDEDYTITSTVIKYQTINVDGEVETNSAVVDEELEQDNEQKDAPTTETIESATENPKPTPLAVVDRPQRVYARAPPKPEHS